MERLQNEVGLLIDDLSQKPELAKAVRDYFGLLKDYLNREKMVWFVHTLEYF